MNRFLKALGLVVLIAFFASCHKDDNSVTPPRDYGVQYNADKDTLETYLKNHYIASVDADYNIAFADITNTATQTSIWDQKVYPLQNKKVTSNEVEYTVYYMVLREGVGQSPTRADNILVSYRGILTDKKITQFDYQPFPQAASSLATTIEGWQEIIPLFKTGTYTDIPDNPNPAKYDDYGAGVMFLPSGLAYFNESPSGLVGAYACMIFNFKLYALEYTDLDSDGILNKDETVPGVDIKDYDTDGDDIANYLDADDDGDNYPTLYEIRMPGTTTPYPFEDIPLCSGGTLKRHLDPNCH